MNKDYHSSEHANRSRSKEESMWNHCLYFSTEESYARIASSRHQPNRSRSHDATASGVSSSAHPSEPLIYPPAQPITLIPHPAHLYHSSRTSPRKIPHHVPTMQPHCTPPRSCPSSLLPALSFPAKFGRRHLLPNQYTEITRMRAATTRSRLEAFFCTEGKTVPARASGPLASRHRGRREIRWGASGVIVEKVDTCMCRR
jgi:hypothetical protein